MRMPRGVVKDHDRVIDRSQVVSAPGERTKYLELTAKEIPKHLQEQAQKGRLKAEEEAKQVQQAILSIANERDTAKAELQRIKIKLGLLGLDIDSLPDQLPESLTVKPVQPESNIPSNMVLPPRVENKPSHRRS